MGYKMPGAPMMDTSKKHGTNANYAKSGMKNADGSAVKPGSPGLLGKIMDPLGLFKKAKGLMGGKKGGACPPAAAPAVPGGAMPAAPVAPVDPDLAAGPVVDPNAGVSAQGEEPVQ